MVYGDIFLHNLRIGIRISTHDFLGQNRHTTRVHIEHFMNIHIIIIKLNGYICAVD